MEFCNVAPKEQHRRSLMSVEHQRHSLMKVFANDAIDAYFAGHHEVLIDEQREEQPYVRWVSVDSPKLRSNPTNSPSMLQVAQRSEVNEESTEARLSLDETLVEEPCSWPSSPVSALQSSSIDALERLNQTHNLSPTPSPVHVPNPTSHSSAATTLFRGSEETTDVFTKAYPNSTNHPIGRLSTSLRRSSYSKERCITGIPIHACNELARSGTMRHLDNRCDQSSSHSEPATICEGSVFIQKLQDLKQWSDTFRLPSIIKPGVAYVPRTTEQQTTERGTYPARQSSLVQSPSICSYQSSPSTLRTWDDASTWSLPSTPTTPTSNGFNVGVCSVLSDESNSTLRTREDRYGSPTSKPWATNVFDSLYDDIDATIEMFTELRPSQL